MSLQARIDAILAAVQLTAPVELADVLELNRRITPALAPGERLDIYHRHRDVVVTVREKIKGRDEVVYGPKILEAT